MLQLITFAALVSRSLKQVTKKGSLGKMFLIIKAIIFSPRKALLRFVMVDKLFLGGKVGRWAGGQMGRRADGQTLAALTSAHSW